MSNVHIAGVEKPLSRLALGTAFFTLEEQERFWGLLDHFVKRGGTVLDSAHVYSGGQSEAVVGAWMASRQSRDRVVVITKCGHGDYRLPAQDLASVLANEIQQSLERLQSDHVDLLMLHRDNAEIPVATIVETLHEEAQQNHARSLGVSNWTCDRIAAANSYATAHGLRGFAAVSNALSLATPVDDFWPGLVTTDTAGEQWHARTRIPLIPFSSQARGFFCGDYTPAMRRQSLSEDPQRMMDCYGTDANFERLERARSLGKELGGYSAIQVALAWVLHRPIPVIPIIGPRSIDELDSCFAALDVSLTPEQSAWLNLGT